jgi:CubicO group peptidase (beta-lactamase class C family)
MYRIAVSLLIVLTLALPASTVAQESGTAWPAGSPEAHGFDSSLLAEGMLTIQESLPAVNSLTIAHNGELILDAAFYPYDGSTPHEVASVTKSMTTTLIGIAIDQGKLAIDDPVLAFFPDRQIANRDARKEAMTVGDLASMTSGLACEAEPDEPTLAAMVASDDFVQFTLDLPMVAEPGTTFSYCSPATHLLSAILTEATGMTEQEFAQEFLFEPLGFGTVYWPVDPQGYSHGWGDVLVYPADAVKLGQLWVNNGMWNGQQVVSPEWVEAAVSIQASTGDEETDYGYGWWVERESEVGGEFAAMGRGGQSVTVFPALGIVIGITGSGGEYDDNEVINVIAPAFVSPEAPLPENPDAEARLAQTLSTLQQAPEPVPVSLPATAERISGTLYTFDEQNPADIAAARLTFGTSDEATIDIAFPDDRANLSGPVGLDGVYRFSPGAWNLPMGMRGTWADEQTFVLEVNQIANYRVFQLTMRFADDTVVVTVEERTHEEVVEVTGTAMEP